MILGHRSLQQARRGRTGVRSLGVFLLSAALLWAGNAFGQARLERERIVLYWGLVPAAIAAEKHPAEQLHGAPRAGGDRVHHLVVALFDGASGQRITDAVVRAQLREVGVVDAPPKYLTPMPVNGQMSYGQMFSVVKDGPYHFRVFVTVPNRSGELQFEISAWSPHRAGP